MTDRYGRAKITTIRRDFDRLRAAIRKHDPAEPEEAWDKCERWVDYVFEKACVNPQPEMEIPLVLSYAGCNNFWLMPESAGERIYPLTFYGTYEDDDG